jgi:hypothetical protein
MNICGANDAKVAQSARALLISRRGRSAERRKGLIGSENTAIALELNYSWLKCMSLLHGGR